MSVEAGTLSASEIVQLSLRHTMFDWTAQSAAHPIPIERAKGVEFFTVDGKRYLDFNSQLWSVNIGHGDARVVEAIRAQAEKLAYISPLHTTEVRARLGAKLAELLPGDMEKVFFTLGGAEAIEKRSAWLVWSPAGTRSWPAIARITAPPVAPSRSRAIRVGGRTSPR